MHRTNKIYQIFLVGICLIAFLIMVGTLGSAFAQESGISQEPIKLSVAKLNEELKLVDSAIDRAIDDPIAKDTSQCNLLSMGAKPCGGPTKYLAYSKQVSDALLLNQLADQYTRIQSATNVLTQAISDCSINQPPTVVIVDGRCSLVYINHAIHY